MLSETIHIKQEYCNECGVAAYATITGLTLQRTVLDLLRLSCAQILHAKVPDMDRVSF